MVVAFRSCSFNPTISFLRRRISVVKSTRSEAEDAGGSPTLLDASLRCLVRRVTFWSPESVGLALLFSAGGWPVQRIGVSASLITRSLQRHAGQDQDSLAASSMAPKIAILILAHWRSYRCLQTEQHSVPFLSLKVTRQPAHIFGFGGGGTFEASAIFEAISSCTALDAQQQAPIDSRSKSG